jgi:ABC transporter substrate binding protein
LPALISPDLHDSGPRAIHRPSRLLCRGDHGDAAASVHLWRAIEIISVDMSIDADLTCPPVVGSGFGLVRPQTAIHEHRAFPEVGGLMSYGPNIHEVFRRTAGYVDKILKGAKPAELPVEQPTNFELVLTSRPPKPSA